MTKENLSEVVMKAAELSTKKQAHEAVEIIFGTITKALSRGEEVSVAGFGIFKVVKSKARAGINPRTKERIQIPASKKPKFRASKSLKDAVK